MRIVCFGMVLVVLVSCIHGEIVNNESLLEEKEESGLRGMMLGENIGALGNGALDTVARDLFKESSTEKEATTIQEGRSHVSEAKVGDDLGKREQLLDSDGMTSDAKRKSSSVTSKKVTSTTSSSSNGKNKGSSTMTEMASARTKKDSGSEEKTTSGSNGKALGKSTSAGDGTSTKEKSTESKKGESDTKDSSAKTKYSSYSSGVYTPSICGTSREEVESFCNTAMPICKYETEQALGHKPFHITDRLRPNQGDCIRRCDSKWGLSDKHCLSGEECHLGASCCVYKMFALGQTGL